MCGITLTLSPTGSARLHDSLAAANAPRGPDTSKTYRETISLLNGTKLDFILTSSVLGLRGDLTAQPMIGETGILAWNGQVFDGLQVKPGENDTKAIFDLLESGSSFEDVLAEIEGPYACTWYNGKDRTLSFQVDPLSRRSLLIALPTATGPTFALSSTRSAYARESSVEMRALLGGEGGIIHLDRITLDDAGSLDLSTALVMRPCLPGPSNYTHVGPINPSLPAEDFTPSDSYARDEVSRFETHLQESVRSRISNIPEPIPGEARVAVLFSGGVDCTLLAYMIHKCLPVDESIELINVAFQRSKSNTIQSGSSSKGWTKPPKVKTKQPNSSNHLEFSSVKRESNPMTIAPEDLKNHSITPDRIPSEYDTPDRLSGYEALEELRSACPGREWRFIEVNVTYEEYHDHRSRIVDLMYPATTEMDLSLAYPLYFASRGIGTLDGSPYTVRSKVYISGLGADEQLGGYARHRHAYNSLSFPGLISSLQTDIAQLPIRNTSRDDRILSSHARDARYPYLSLGFIGYLSEVPIWAKVYYEAGEGWGDKLLLRLAADRAGLKGTARRVKRAMQFGSRSAKIDGGVKGKAAGKRAIE